MALSSDEKREFTALRKQVLGHNCLRSDASIFVLLVRFKPYWICPTWLVSPDRIAARVRVPSNDVRAAIALFAQRGWLTQAVPEGGYVRIALGVVPPAPRNPAQEPEVGDVGTPKLGPARTVQSVQTVRTKKAYESKVRTDIHYGEAGLTDGKVGLKRWKSWAKANEVTWSVAG